MSMSKFVSSCASKISSFSNKYPISRGMVSYGLIWPTSCLIQQSFDGKKWGTYDWAQCARYSIYGTFINAPILFMWMRFATRMWPSQTIRGSLFKAAIEQVTYGPVAVSCFFLGMSLLEGKTIDRAVTEVKEKFMPTYQVGVCVWPCVQTVNYYFIAEKNRVTFNAACGFLWALFLAFMKQRESANNLQKIVN